MTIDGLLVLVVCVCGGGSGKQAWLVSDGHQEDDLESVAWHTKPLQGKNCSLAQ